MLTDIKQTYRDSTRFALALPLVAAVPFTAELIQHLIEVRVGMFDSFAGAEAAGSHPARRGFGYVKVLTLFLIGYPVFRFLASGGDRRAALSVTRTSALLFGAVVLLSLAMMVLNQAAGSLVGQAVANERMVLAIGLGGFLMLIIFDTCFAPWKVAAALGNAKLTIPASFRLMHRHVPWSFGYFLAIMLPLMIVHYALNIAAIGLGPGAMWTLLALDSIVAAYLGILLASAVYRMAQRAADKSGLDLASGGADPLPVAV